MTPLENILIIIVVIFVIYSWRQGSSNDSAQSWRCVSNTGQVANVHLSGCKCPPCLAKTQNAPEVAAIKESQEKFTNCGAAMTSNALSSCSVDGDFAYAVNDFGAPGAAFSDWVKSNAIDPDVIKNHNAFIIDRANGDPNSQNRIGGTVSYDSLDQFTYLPFTGLSRPQLLPPGVYCNPTMVPEIGEGWSRCPTIRTGENYNCASML